MDLQNKNTQPVPSVDDFDMRLIELLPTYEQLSDSNPEQRNVAKVAMLGALGDFAPEELKRFLGLAFESPVSGLPNRNVCTRVMEDALHQVAVDGIPRAALFYDLVDFGNVNKVLGHSVGDLFLGVFGPALDETGRKVEGRDADLTFDIVEPQPKDPNDRSFNQGGDEFSRLMVGGHLTPELLTMIADRNALQILRNPAVQSLIATYPGVHTGIRVGITLLDPTKQHSFADIQRDADPKTNVAAYYTINYSEQAKELTIYNQQLDRVEDIQTFTQPTFTA